MSTYTVKKQSEPHTLNGRPLGRLVEHDERSKRYLEPTRDPATYVSKRWPRQIPVLDQGNVGSCTGNAGAGCLGTEPYYSSAEVILALFRKRTAAQIENEVAIEFYHEATVVDGYDGTYPPDDTGSSGLAIGKSLKADGYISGYTHATSIEAALSALQKGPVITGVNWYEGFDNPDKDGLVKVSGSVRGGHEFVVDETDVENKLVWFTNSWSSSWGVKGRACMSWDDWARLLSEDGDVTVFTPLTAPEPTPTPTPTPVPVPPTPSDPADLTLASETIAWANAPHVGKNKKAAKSILKWARAKGFLR